jgi:hypothetical protein
VAWWHISDGGGFVLGVVLDCLRTCWCCGAMFSFSILGRLFPPAGICGLRHRLPSTTLTNRQHRSEHVPHQFGLFPKSRTYVSSGYYATSKNIPLYICVGNSLQYYHLRFSSDAATCNQTMVAASVAEDFATATKWGQLS